MKSSVKYLKPTVVKLTIEASKEEILSAKIDAINKLKSKYKIPGFRPGKAPVDISEKYIDPAMLSEETINIAVNSIYLKALFENKLRSVDRGEISISSFVPYESLKFSATVDVLGQIKLGEYKKLGIQKPIGKITPKAIDEVLERLRLQLSTRSEVKRAAKDGDEVVIDFTGTEDANDKAIAGADGKNFPLILGSKTFIPGFETKLIGAKAGETKEIKVTFPSDYNVTYLRNMKAKFTVTINKVYEVKLPEINDAFASKVGNFKSLSELKADIKRELKLNQDQELQVQYQNKLVDHIVSKTEIAIPETLINEDKEKYIFEARQNASYRGQTWSEFLQSENLTEKQFDEQARSISENRVKTGLILGEIASLENISVDNTELEARLIQLKAAYNNDPQMQHELSDKRNHLDIKNRILVEKTLSRIEELQ